MNQQYAIRAQLSSLPGQIQRAKDSLAKVMADVATRDAHPGEEFSMTVGNRGFAGKGAREEAAKTLTQVVLSWRDDTTLQPRARFRGFEILSRGKGRLHFGDSPDDERAPELFVRGAATYSANLNAESAAGTVQSIEHALRFLERHADKDSEQIERLEKNACRFSKAGEQIIRTHDGRLRGTARAPSSAQRCARSRQERSASCVRGVR